MPLNIRTYHELTEPDRSGLGEQIATQRRRLAARLAAVGRVVVVMSGKGGVGEAGAMRELLADVAWGPLDVLLLDLPPGMQRFLELCDLLPAPPAVLTVTIPTPESRDAVRRALRAATERRSPLLGVVENMVGGPFAGTAGADLAVEFGVPVLARIPWHPTPDTWAVLAGRLG